MSAAIAGLSYLNSGNYIDGDIILNIRHLHKPLKVAGFEPVSSNTGYQHALRVEPGAMIGKAKTLPSRHPLLLWL